jgi:hypothetical protein
MTTESNINIQNRSETDERSRSAETVLGWAVFGCLAAGGVGIVRALGMETGLDVLLCLLGSMAAFGMVFYIYFRKD